MDIIGNGVKSFYQGWDHTRCLNRRFFAVGFHTSDILPRLNLPCASALATVKIMTMEEHRHLPDGNRLSVLTATILLAYALTPIIKIIPQEIVIRLPGVVFSYRLDFLTIVSILVALIAAVGAEWLLQSHPHQEHHQVFQHIILPGLTAWVIGVPLSSLSLGVEWWAVFTLGGILLVLVLVAEYIVVDFSDLRFPLATIGLTAISFALYLFLVIALRGAGLRLYSLLPAVSIPLGLVSLRTLYLRLEGRWCVAWAVAISFLIAQIAAGLHYWPLSPLKYGLILVGPAYALTTMVGAIEEGESWRSLWIEPLVLLIIIWGLAFIVQG